MRTKITITLAVLLLSGCLAGQLRAPAEDHHVQAQTIADSCRKEHVLGEGLCTQDMLDEMAKQAACIQAITEGDECKKDDGL